ncbi:hypothetical protein [Nocardioides alcanivorans]|uniref:hypothetical protein n=1 Tax=Nocardioides alcanivorans TaxID=2897352 RepID=UPI001F2E2F01|nr:hypothetical protein [Nocardioides alcanivorans]
MTKFSGTFSVATAVFLLAAVAACGSDSDAEPAPKPTPSASSPTSAAPSTPGTPEESAAAAAEVTVGDYYALTDLLLQDDAVALDRLEEVAISTQLSAQKNFLTSERATGTQQRGDTEIVEAKVQSVSLDNSEPNAGRVPSVTIDVCWDVSDVNVVDASGKSMVPADRADRGWTRLTVANYTWDTDPDTGWRVAGGEDLEKTPCAG